VCGSLNFWRDRDSKVRCATCDAFHPARTQGSCDATTVIDAAGREKISVANLTRARTLLRIRLQKQCSGLMWSGRRNERALLPPHLRTAPTSFGELLRGCGPHPRHRDSVHVPDVTVSSTGEEAFERAARSIEKISHEPASSTGTACRCFQASGTCAPTSRSHLAPGAGHPRRRQTRRGRVRHLRCVGSVRLVSQAPRAWRVSEPADTAAPAQFLSWCDGLARVPTSHAE